MDYTTSVITGINTRLSYVHVKEPQAFNGGKAKYSLVAIIPKTDEKTVNRIRACIQGAYERGEAVLMNKGVLPPLSAIRSPLRDGDLERPDDPAYAGCWFISAKSDRQPDVVDAEAHRVTDPSIVYSGCYARVAMNFFAYNTNGNRGITCGLNGLQFIRDGEPLGSHFDGEKVFSPVGQAEAETDEAEAEAEWKEMLG